MYTKIVHGKSTYTVRKYKMSALSMNNFAIDLNPLVGF